MRHNFERYIGHTSPNGRWVLTGPVRGSGLRGVILEGENAITGERVAMKVFTDENAFEDELAVAETLNCAPWALCILGEFELPNGLSVAVYKLAETDLEKFGMRYGAANSNTTDLDINEAMFRSIISNYKMPMHIRVSLVMDLIMCLRALLLSNIVHMDIKPANILIYDFNGKYSLGLGDLGGICAYTKSKAFPTMPVCMFVSTHRKTTLEYSPRAVRANNGMYLQSTDFKWVDLVGTAMCILYVLTGCQFNTLMQPDFSLNLPDLITPGNTRVSGSMLEALLITMVYGQDVMQSLASFVTLSNAVGLPLTDKEVEPDVQAPEMLFPMRPRSRARAPSKRNKAHPKPKKRKAIRR